MAPYDAHDRMTVNPVQGPWTHFGKMVNPGVSLSKTFTNCKKMNPTHCPPLALMKVIREAQGTSPDGSLGRGGGRPRSRAATAAAAEVAALAAPNAVADAVTDAAVDAVGHDPPQSPPPKFPRRLAAARTSWGKRRAGR